MAARVYHDDNALLRSVSSVFLNFCIRGVVGSVRFAATPYCQAGAKLSTYFWGPHKAGS